MNKALLLLTLLFFSCSSSTFNLKNDKYYIKGGKLAIIAGDKSELSAELAEQLSKSLQQCSKFDILSKKSIVAKIGNISQSIKGPFSSAYFDEIIVDYSYSDLIKIKEIQKTLDVDYLYIIWNPSIVQFHRPLGIKHRAHVLTQLFKSFDFQEIGNAKYDITYTYFGIADKPFKEAIYESADESAKKIAADLGMLKFKKK